MDKQTVLPVCRKMVGVRPFEIELLQYILYLKEEEGRQNVYLDSRIKVIALVNLFVKMELGEVKRASQDNFVEYDIWDGKEHFLALICDVFNTKFKNISVSKLKRAEPMALLLYLLGKEDKKATLTIDDLREIYHITDKRLTRYSRWKEKLDVICRELEEIGVIITINPRKTSPTSKITEVDFSLLY